MKENITDEMYSWVLLIKKLLDEVFVISRMIKVDIRVKSRG